jgi:hypothetical protein
MTLVASTEEMVTGMLRDELNEHGSVRPPWIRIPGAHPCEIAWRMGAGESHLMVWSEWSGAHDPNERIAAIKKHGPVPADWAWWAADVAGLIAGEDPYEFAFEDIEQRLAAIGVVVSGKPKDDCGA